MPKLNERLGGSMNQIKRSKMYVYLYLILIFISVLLIVDFGVYIYRCTSINTFARMSYPEALVEVRNYGWDCTIARREKALYFRMPGPWIGAGLLDRLYQFHYNDEGGLTSHFYIPNYAFP